MTLPGRVRSPSPVRELELDLTGLLRWLLRGDVPADVEVECPLTGALLPVSHYVQPLVSAALAPPGSYLFHGQITRAWIRTDTGSLGLTSRPATARPTTDLPVFIKAGIAAAITGAIPTQDLPGRHLIALAVRRADKRYLSVLDPRMARILQLRQH